MTGTVNLRWCAAAASVALLMAVGDVRATGDGGGVTSSLVELVDAGRFQDAYHAVLVDGALESADALARLANTLLSRAIESPDSYARWYGLQAAVSLHSQSLAESARKVARSGGRYEQSLALEVLVHMDVEGSREEFLAALNSPFRSVRLRALHGLSRLHDKSFTQRYIEVLSGDPDPDLRAFAADALGALGSADAKAALQRALDDPVGVVQEQAVRALVKLGDASLPDIMRRRLAEAPPEGRARILRLAGLVGARELAPTLGPFLADPDVEVRAAAAGAVLQLLEPARKSKP